MPILEPIFAVLNDAEVDYVVVGGVAVVLHGHARLTADVDLIIDLEPSAARKALQALSSLGLRPRAPVPAEAFADPEQRRRWVEEKGMQVFSLWDPATPMREVDLFVMHPLPFEELMRDSVVVQLEATRARIASIEHLVTMKRLANRPQDREDIEALEAIQSAQADED